MVDGGDTKLRVVVGAEQDEGPPRPRFYVGIGASAGGLEAIETFFGHMPTDSGLAFVVIQHLSPDYKSLMVELLSKRTDMPVHRAEEGMAVEPNHVYLIPPKKNLTIFHGKLMLADQDSSRGINLPIDVFLRSLAEDQGERAVAIILSGTGSDGMRGVRAVKQLGGMVMVQDEHSARFDGMPRSAVSTGLADFILPPEQMPGQLLAFASHPYSTRDQRSDTLLGDEDGLTRIFSLVRERTKADFTHYKPSTIIRRIERRMTVNQIEDLRAYVAFLQEHPGEVVSLYRELLIGVTSFFRDPEVFERLGRDFLPELIGRSANREMRLWVAGCSTGEEAYTLAILIREALLALGLNRDVKIFATDIDRDAVMAAGTGIYPESITADLSSALIAKYFYRRGESYQVVSNIREMVVFAQHDLVRDPPFTNIDLVSCRNLLIYLQPVLQHKVLEVFNFSLNAGGVLLLGSSESIGEMDAYFETLHGKSRLYRSRGRKQPPSPKGVYESFRSASRHAQRATALPRATGRHAELEDERLLTRYLSVLSARYVPLSVVVNERMEILHTLGDTDGYFKLPSGRAQYDVSKMVAKELSIPLATGIQKVFREGAELVYSNIRLRRGKDLQTLRLRILPLPERKGQEPLVAVFLEEEERKPVAPEREGAVYDASEEAQQRIQDLEQDLQFTKENLQATIEELETANEELQATNEELLASNEELQSTNEELQSTNEELHTVNAEYQKKVIELTELNNDVENLLAGSQFGKLLLDENLEIRRYSLQIAEVFRIRESDVGRPLEQLSHSLVDFEPVAVARRVQERHRPEDSQVADLEGRWYLVRTLPYQVGPRAFSGVMMTFVDITEARRTEKALEDSRQRAADIVEHMPAGLFLYRQEGERLVLADGNPEAVRLTGLDLVTARGREFTALWPGPDSAKLLERLWEVLATGRNLHETDFLYADERIAGDYHIHAFCLPGQMLAVSFEDQSRLHKVERDLAATERKYHNLFETMAQGVVYQDASGHIVAANPAAEEILGLSLDQMQGRTSTDPRWRAMDAQGADLPGEAHPSMVTLRTGEPVRGFLMGVYNPARDTTRWISVSATPLRREGEERPSQVYTTFEDITEHVRGEARVLDADATSGPTKE